MTTPHTHPTDIEALFSAAAHELDRQEPLTVAELANYLGMRAEHLGRARAEKRRLARANLQLAATKIALDRLDAVEEREGHAAFVSEVQSRTDLSAAQITARPTRGVTAYVAELRERWCPPRPETPAQARRRARREAEREAGIEEEALGRDQPSRTPQDVRRMWRNVDHEF